MRYHCYQCYECEFTPGLAPDLDFLRMECVTEDDAAQWLRSWPGSFERGCYPRCGEAYKRRVFDAERRRWIGSVEATGGGWVYEGIAKAAEKKARASGFIYLTDVVDNCLAIRAREVAAVVPRQQRQYCPLDWVDVTEVVLASGQSYTVTETVGEVMGAVMREEGRG